jgi:CRP/FNR family transcriptional regulator
MQGDRRAAATGIRRVAMGSYLSHARKSCFSCQACSRAEWCGLSKAELGRIDAAKTVREYTPGDVLYHQGDPSSGVFCVESGLVGLRKIDAEGNSVLVRLAYPGDTIGFRSLVCGEDHRLGAEVLKPSTICLIDAATAMALAKNNPALCLRLLRHMANDLSDAEEKFVQSNTLEIEERIAYTFLLLKRRCAVAAKDGGLTIELPVSRQDLAAMVGIRPETMSRAIRKFADDGVVFISGRTVRIPDPATLFAPFELPN